MSTASGLKWRLYNKDTDAAAVTVLHAKQEEMLGRTMDLPNLAERPVVLPLVCEENGEIVGALYAEAILEICFVGTDPRVTASARFLKPEVVKFAKERRVRFIRMLCPKWVKDTAAIVSVALRRAGFVSTDEEYANFLMDLREPVIAASTPMEGIPEAQHG
jgi:hypothetical protein